MYVVLIGREVNAFYWRAAMKITGNDTLPFLLQFKIKKKKTGK